MSDLMVFRQGLRRAADLEQNAYQGTAINTNQVMTAGWVEDRLIPLLNGGFGRALTTEGAALARQMLS